ncbi:MAG TPA: FlgD immunoglobulin-like domain containing protein, partial [Bacteroidota bacterium]|nr:FlgD immunoglobulin-like domain containing protein [Bacteroidota bacterium]
LVNADMRKTGTVTIADSTLGAFEILECQSTSAAVSTNTGWNLISLPVIVGDRRSGSLFPHKTSSVFFYDNNYRQTDTLSYGTGYWVKSEIETMTGCRISLDTVTIHQGWNLIGGISFPLTVSSIIQNPPNISSSQYFGYNGSGYVIVSTLEPGHGYWVKARAPGIFILDSANFQSPKIGQDPLAEFHSLVVSDGAGHQQEIYFGKESDHIDDEMFELPPPAPNSELDVRFGNQRILATHSKMLQNTLIFPIFLTSISSKIFFSWGVENEEKFTYILCKRFRGKVVEELPLRDKGTQSISLEDGSSFSIEVHQIYGSTEVPRTYMLSEAYPNPFNPVTHIRYAIPSDSYVHIQIYSVMGEEIATLVDAKRSAGIYDVAWNGLRSDGQAVGSGVYFTRLVASQNGAELNSSSIQFASTKKIIFLK